MCFVHPSSTPASSLCRSERWSFIQNISSLIFLRLYLTKQLGGVGRSFLWAISDRLVKNTWMSLSQRFLTLHFHFRLHLCAPVCWGSNQHAEHHLGEGRLKMPRSVLLLFHEAHQAFAGTRADVRSERISRACCQMLLWLGSFGCSLVSRGDRKWCRQVLFGTVRVCFDTRCVSFVEQSFSREQRSARTSAFILAETETHWLRMNFSDEHRLGFSRLYFLLCRCFYSFIWFFVLLLCLLVVVSLKNKKQHWARKSFGGFKMFCC